MQAFIVQISISYNYLFRIIRCHWQSVYSSLSNLIAPFKGYNYSAFFFSRQINWKELRVGIDDTLTFLFELSYREIS